MNVYMTDTIAREHQADLLADAAAGRAAHRASSARKSRTGARDGQGPHGTAATGVRALGHPLAAFRSWLAAGQL